MQEVVSSNKDWLDVLIQVLIVVIPIVLAWFIRTYVRGTVAEKDVAAIIRLSNAAIDYVENLDKQGELVLPPDVKKGTHKLKLAGAWLEDELRRSSIKISDEEAQKWIASEFQKRVGDVRMVGTIAELSKMAVDLVQDLEQRDLLEIPADVDRGTQMVELAADWLLAQLAKQGATISREEALAWVRAEFLQQLRGGGDVELPASAPLADLADKAVEFVEKLEISGQLTPPIGATLEQFVTEVAVAWAVTEAAKQGLTVTKVQLAEAVSNALQRRGGLANGNR